MKVENMGYGNYTYDCTDPYCDYCIRMGIKTHPRRIEPEIVVQPKVRIREIKPPKPIFNFKRKKVSKEQVHIKNARLRLWKRWN